MEEFKIGDQVTHPFRGIGIIVKPPHVCVRYDTEVRLDGGYLSTKFWEEVSILTKIKSNERRNNV